MSLELLLTILTICAVIITASIVFVAYIIFTSIKKFQSALSLVDDTVRDIASVRSGVKTMILSMANKYIEKLQGGERDNE